MSDVEESPPPVPDSPAGARATPFNNFGVAIQSWYVAASSSAVRRKRAVTVDWLGRRLALFRGEDGIVQALEARCPHLGADLGRGTVLDTRLRCSFHHWVFDRNGNCRAIPLQNKIPRCARTFAYPTEEKYGVIWVFNGPRPLFPIPFFEGLDNKTVCVGRLPDHIVPCHPHVVASNGLDLQHFQTVHRAALEGACRLETPDGFRTRLWARLSVRQENIVQRLMALGGLKSVEMEFTSWGGNLATLESRVGPLVFRCLFANQPFSFQSTKSLTFLLVPRFKGAWGRFLPPRLVLGILRPIYARIIREDLRVLAGIHFHANLIDVDQALRTFIAQVNAMSVYPDPATGVAAP